VRIAYLPAETMSGEPSTPVDNTPQPTTAELSVTARLNAAMGANQLLVSLPHAQFCRLSTHLTAVVWAEACGATGQASKNCWM